MADLEEEAGCPICLDSYKDTVLLPCGHSFCKSCITSALDAQEEESRVQTCPECMAKYDRHPLLWNSKPFNASLVKEGGEIFCTHCIESTVPAVKTCLQCETSMCDEHLTGHNFVDHVLSPPTANFKDQKCSVHDEYFKYYCIQDGACICSSCFLTGPHNGHDVEMLDQAFITKKKTMKNTFENQMIKRGEIDQQIQSLQDHKKAVEEKANEESERLSDLFLNLMRGLEDMENNCMSCIYSQLEQTLDSLSDQIQDLEVQKDELARKMSRTEELCNMTDPINVLQHPELDPGVKDLENDEQPFYLDHIVLSLTSYRSIKLGLYRILSESTFCIKKASGLLLNVDTADDSLHLGDDLRAAFVPGPFIDRPVLPESFRTFDQVMSLQSFSRGTCYWEVDLSQGYGRVDFGMCYKTIPRLGLQSIIGNNKQSWGMHFEYYLNFARHNKMFYELKVESTQDSLSIGVYLDYDGGILSFYQLGEPIKLFYTFNDHFTEPLYAVLGVDGNAWVRLQSGWIGG
ncbi:E3 ubiquitin/ISG15 ligase TRIM25-like [Hyperolius riggenbachi]|uniref:E3 ubiquitin/ISG15 ligase TRIM25-like n=1 Tax=Hyperolius riggenbachi TaxID=752182 RepID=UPI0035A318D2